MQKHNIFFVIDSAQSAGVLNIDFKDFNLSALTFTGHKSLLVPKEQEDLLLMMI